MAYSALVLLALAAVSRAAQTCPAACAGADTCSRPAANSWQCIYLTPYTTSTFTTPADLTALIFTVFGGSGGSIPQSAQSGGRGATIFVQYSDLATLPATFTLEVGENGSDGVYLSSGQSGVQGAAGGRAIKGSGGQGGDVAPTNPDIGAYSGGGGGSISAILVDDAYIVVAGGGGGSAAALGGKAIDGGDAGAANQPGQSGASSDGASAGAGGEIPAVGAAATLAGGSGDNSVSDDGDAAYSSGGGGGGYNAGSGGGSANGAAAGGGGGASFVNTAVFNVIGSATSDQPSIAINYFTSSPSGGAQLTRQRARQRRARRAARQSAVTV